MRVTHFFALLQHIPLFGWQLFSALGSAGWHALPRRLLLFMGIFVAFAGLNLLHLTGFLLDEVLFAGYRRVQVKSPLFILGIPRSGTTLLQRVLALDERFTTLRTWEALLAPSISERYFYAALGKLLQRPAQGLGWWRGRLLRQMDAIHVLGLREPEEDFLLWIPLEASLLLAFIAPNHEGYWDLGAFHDRVPPARRKLLIDYYHACLQKHLYYHGPKLCLLSKNPSFTSVLPDLQQRFPDAHFVACVRQPSEVVPSQLSALRPTFQLLSGAGVPAPVIHRMLLLLRHYYSVLGTTKVPVLTLGMQIIGSDLFSALTRLYQHCGIGLSAALADAYQQRALQARDYRSEHKYRPDEFILSAEQLAEFSAVWPFPDSSRAA